MSCDSESSSIVLPTGSDGLNGYNAYTTVATTLTTTFLADGTTQYTVLVTYNQSTQNSGKWAAIGQIIFIETIGYCTVVSSTTGSIIFTINSGYGNSLPSSLILGSKISPAGLIGLTGTPASSNGARILYNNDTPIFTTTNTGDILHTYTVPANTLLTNMDTIIVRNTFIAENPNFDNVVGNNYGLLSFGVNSLHLAVSGIAFDYSGAKGFKLVSYITRDSNTQISYKTQIVVLGVSTSNVYIELYSATVTGVITGLNLTTTSYDIALKAYNTVIGNISSQYLNIEYIPKV